MTIVGAEAGVGCIYFFFLLGPPVLGSGENGSRKACGWELSARRESKVPNTCFVTSLKKKKEFLSISSKRAGEVRDSLNQV